jgi:hypothetical protein
MVEAGHSTGESGNIKYHCPTCNRLISYNYNTDGISNATVLSSGDIEPETPRAKH